MVYSGLGRMNDLIDSSAGGFSICSGDILDIHFINRSSKTKKEGERNPWTIFLIPCSFLSESFQGSSIYMYLFSFAL